MERHIDINRYDYDLPEERIAKFPLAERSASKLLVYRHGEISERHFADIGEELPAGQLLVFNNTKVIRARIIMHKPSGARIEVFCLEPCEPADYERAFAVKGSCEWSCIVGNLKKWKEGYVEINFDHEGRAEYLRAWRVGEGGREQRVRFEWSADMTFGQLLEPLGRMPIPPYLARERTREAAVESKERSYPLATDKTWVREKIMPGKGAGTAADVSRRAVKGRAYHDKVASLPIPKRAREAVYAESRRILRDRDGTGYERMSVVSWKKGERVTDTFGHGLKSQACGLTAKQVEACRRTKGGVVLIHNHPMSSPPSWTDIRTVAENDWVRSSVVACHDGTIYEITVNDRSVVQTYEELRELAKRECPNVGGDVIDQLATEMLYERNEEAKWFRLTKKK